MKFRVILGSFSQTKLTESHKSGTTGSDGDDSYI